MSLRHYDKKPKTFAEQVNLLQRRGLQINNTLKAERVLSSISYNRLSNYWHPFLKVPKEDEIFEKGITFERIFRIYQFDSKLRTLLFNAIEQIEIAVRTQVIYHVSHRYNDGYGYEKRELYQSSTRYHRAMLRIAEAEKQSTLPFVLKFRNKYSNEHLPAWKSFELLSFRTLYNLLDNIEGDNERRAIAAFFGLHHTVLSSWLNSIVYIRNICAHNARLWNNVLTIAPVWPKSPHLDWVDRWENEVRNENKNDKRLKAYAGICMIQYLLQSVNPYSTFKRDLLQLLAAYPEAEATMMGMPTDWRNQPLWKVD